MKEQAEILDLGGLLTATQAAIARRQDTHGDAFAMAVQGQTVVKRPEAEARMREALMRLAVDPDAPDGQPVELGSLGGFTVVATARRSMRATPEVLVTLAGVPKSDIWLRDEQEIAGSAIVTRLENRLTGLDRLRDDTAHSIERLHGEVARAEGLLGRPFPQADLLAAVRARVSAIAAQLEDMAERAGRDQASSIVTAVAIEVESSVDLEAER